MTRAITPHTRAMTIPELLALPVDSSMSDRRLCALVSTVNRLFLRIDATGGDTKPLDPVIHSLYAHLRQRITGAFAPRQSSPLLRALYDLIYGRTIDSQLPDDAIYFYTEATMLIVDSHRRHPVLNDHDYIFHLTSTMTCLLPDELHALRTEIAAIIDRWTPYYDSTLRRWTDCTPAESRRRTTTLRRLRLYLPEINFTRIW